MQRVHGAATERKNEAFLITQSFSPEEFSGDNEKDVARVHGAGMELADELAANSPYFVATHTDAKGGHVHNHIVVLNHDYSTGKGAPKSLKHHPSVRKANDSVMRDLGMEVTKQDEIHLTPVEAHAIRQGRSIEPAAKLDEISNDNWRHMRESTDRKLQGYQEKLDGLVDGLASDYIPTSLLPSAVRLVSQRLATLPEAVRLVTSGPAACVGLDDRGTLTEGTVADLVLVDFSKTWPSVITMRAATAAEV